MRNDLYGRYAIWKGWYLSKFGTLDLEQSLYFSRELRQCGCPDLHGLRVLEIGFGNGAFASWAAKQGANYQGTEVIPELVARAQNSGLAVYGSGIPINSFVDIGSLDIAVAFDVFEHIPVDSLKDLLRSLSGPLKASGLVIARVPSGDSPFSRAIQHGDLTHKCTLGSSAIRQLAIETGYRVVSIRDSALPIRGLGLTTCLRRLGVVTIRKLSYRLITMLMGGGPFILSPNMTFVLQREASLEG